MKSKLYKISPNDNVAIALTDLVKGEIQDGITVLSDIKSPHKIALEDIRKGENVIKYGFPIGHALRNIKKGEWVHTHNLTTNITSALSYSGDYKNDYTPSKSNITFEGYERKNGEVGIRNEIWIIPTVGCVNKIASVIERESQKFISGSVDGVFAYSHPYGCSQTGDDQENTIKVLSALAQHPNACGILVLSLGCENVNVSVLKEHLGNYDKEKIKFLICQESDDEIKDGTEIIKKLCEIHKDDKRTPINVSRLKIGYKCGGSDAFSGITANRLCGEVNDMLTALGCTTVLTEVPEMFGAEQILFKRSLNNDIFQKQVNLINSFKNYFVSHGESCADNPSPGNHEGGITTLDEKSLGCIQKGGKSIVTDVLTYVQKATEPGLNLLYGPGNDIVSTSDLTCSGVHMILFTTGRGTSLGAPVPTVKISSNSKIYNKKKNWIDFNAGRLLDGEDVKSLAYELQSKILSIASGEKTRNEINNYRDISIFKDGVTL